MRILYVTNAILANPDAPASRANGLSAALAQRGIEVDLVGIAPALSQERPGLRVTALKRRNIPRLGTLSWHIQLFETLCTRLSRPYDAVLMREIPYTLEPATFARLKGIPLILEVNGAAPEAKPGIDKWARTFYLQNYKWASKIIVLTDALKEYMRENFPIPADRLKVIPNAADESRFFPRDKKDSRKSLGIPEDSFCLLYMGSYHTQQGVDCVLPLSKILQDRIPNLCFLMTGAGPAKEKLQKEIEKAGLKKHFHFTGSLPPDRLGEVISSTDIAFSPVRPEDAWRTELTFPQKIVEYIACGVPVLAMGYSRVQKEMVAETGSGALIDPGEGFIDRLANRVIQWHENPEQRIDMGRKAAELSRTRYNYDSVAKEFDELFRSL
ncbi:MAG: glycosyltransferase family 4 protein [Planctomycetota bacterium]|jgi:glycosyltransferase involved in cell wall biosynthesis|nr:glycosyltransferase family 4 protein [Planctomycetota bacterium]